MPSEEHPHRESFPTIPSFTLWTLLWVYPALIVSFMVWNLGLSNTLMLFNMTLHRLYTGRRLSIKYGPRLQDYSIQKTKILVSHLMLTSMDYTFSLQNWWPMGVYKILNMIMMNTCNINTRNWKMGRLANILKMRSGNDTSTTTPRYDFHVFFEHTPINFLSFLLALQKNKQSRPQMPNTLIVIHLWRLDWPYLAHIIFAKYSLIWKTQCSSRMNQIPGLMFQV